MNSNKLKGMEIGSRLHDNWRAPRKKEDGTYEPRWKVTKDAGYLGVDGKSRENENGEMEVDIANLSFEELPKDWQKENLEAGLAVAPIVGEKEELSSEEMETAASEVHDEWVSRRWEVIRARMNELANEGLSDAEVQKKVDEEFAWDKALMVDYSELSEEEKQKDRDQVVEALKLNKEISKGDISLDDIEKKFDSKEKER